MVSTRRLMFKLSVHHLAIIGFLLRLIYTFSIDNIYYADEIFQILEPAFRQVTGLGFISLEYLLGIRHWFLPGLVSLILSPLFSLGISAPVLYTLIIKIVFATFSISLIYAAYYLTAAIYRSHSLALLSAAATTVWYEFIVFSPRMLYELMAAYLLLGGLALALTSPRRSTLFLSGAFISAVFFLRPQYVLAVSAACLILILSPSLKRPAARPAFILGLVTSVFTFGLIDHFTWGSFWHSTLTYLLLNLDRGSSLISDALDPVGQPTHFYLLSLTISSGGLFLLCLDRIKRHRLLLFLAALVVLAHYPIGHKEYRFILAAIPFLLIISTLNLYHRLNRRFPAPKASLITILLISIISLLGLSDRLPFIDRLHPGKLIYSGPALALYHQLSSLPNVCGLYDASQSWLTTGGYYHLNLSIPFYSLYYPPPTLDQVNYIISADPHVALPQVVPFTSVGHLTLYHRVGECLPDPHYSTIRLVPRPMETL